MAPQQLPRSELAAFAHAFNKAVKAGAAAGGTNSGGVGLPQSALAIAMRELKLTRNQAKHRLELCLHQALIKDGGAAKPKDASQGAMETARLERRNDELAKQLREAREHLEAVTHKLDTVLNLKKSEPGHLKWTLAAPKVAKRTNLIPILFTSDFQAGEVIKAAELDGMNEYNMDVFSQRYKKMIADTIDCAANHIGAADMPGIFYLRGGDPVSGEIHADLAETNDLRSIPAVRHVLQHERAGIAQLRARFGDVRVITVPSNHSRITPGKPRSKNVTTDSLDTLMAWWLEMLYEDDPKVTFQTSASPDALFKVWQWQFLLSHGDRMGSRGGTGFIGTEATILRGHHKLHSNFSSTGVQVHCILTGHLHTSMKSVRGFGNGALAGYSDFARDIRAIPDAAKQWLLFSSPKRPVGQFFELQLSDQPTRTSAL